ncbi:MAG: ferritin family protein [Candidatus Thermoplasmatota archaeon]|nr:ferritin family protein [Candidatus Thermoplasmatota archaeon]
MDLHNFKLEELLLAAIKSEEESKKLYYKLTEKTGNGLLQDKLEFLAKEEDKHRKFLEEVYKNHFPDRDIKIPISSPVPLPTIELKKDMALSKLLYEAMKAEMAASDFYISLAKKFEKGTKLHNTLLYFSDMEKGHYKILEIEKESMERFEEADVYWPMVHAGP